MNRSPVKLLCLLAVALLSTFSLARAESPFIGRWALTLPSGSAGWLGVEEKDGKLQGSILGSGGSVLRVDGVKIDGDALTITRVTKDVSETITGKVTGD